VVKNTQEEELKKKLQEKKEKARISFLHAKLECEKIDAYQTLQRAKESGHITRQYIPNAETGMTKHDEFLAHMTMINNLPFPGPKYGCERLRGCVISERLKVCQYEVHMMLIEIESDEYGVD